MLTANLASLRAITDPRVSLMPYGDRYDAMHFLAINQVGRTTEVRCAISRCARPSLWR